MSQEKLEHLLARVEAMSAEMDVELAKSNQEWDRICKIIVETGKATASYEIGRM